MTTVRKEFEALRHQASQLIWNMLIASPGVATKIEYAYLKAAHRLLSDEIVRSLPLFPERNDFLALENDLYYIVGAIDPLIHEIGKELAANSNAVTQADVRDCFSNQLRSAFDGNAFYCCEKAAEAEIENISDDAEHSTLNRAGQGV